MTVEIEYEAELDLKVPYQEIIKTMVNAVLKREGCPFEAEVNVIITDNDEIQVINLETRGIDSFTDVLSFPMVEYDSPSDFSKLCPEDVEFFNPESGELLLGDIMVSAEKVSEQAEQYGHSRERELAFLITHSMLHLLGYDHMEEEERVVMEEKQEAVLVEQGYLR